MSERKGNDTRKISRANGKRLVRPNRRAGHREMTYSQLWTFAAVATENPIRAGADTAMGYLRAGMIDLLKLLGGFLVGLFRSQAAREAEMAFLRQQLLVLKRSAPARLRLRNADRLIFVWLYRLFPSLLGAAVIFQPETLVRWHRSGFRVYWLGSLAVVSAGRQYGELLKLGIDIAQSTVAKYITRRRHPPSPGWRAFLRNHTAHIAAVDLFVVPTIGFKLLYGLVILRLERRRVPTGYAIRTY